MFVWLRFIFFYLIVFIPILRLPNKISSFYNVNCFLRPLVCSRDSPIFVCRIRRWPYIQKRVRGWYNVEIVSFRVPVSGRLTSSSPPHLYPPPNRVSLSHLAFSAVVMCFSTIRAPRRLRQRNQTLSHLHADEVS